MLSQTAQKLHTGRYRVREGDTPSSIAERLYGDTRKAPVLLQENGYDWEPGSIINVPNFSGFEMVARKGEQFTSLYRRAFNGTTAAGEAIDEFFKWNGGKREIQPGETVFFADSRKRSYGY